MVAMVEIKGKSVKIKSFCHYVSICSIFQCKHVKMDPRKKLIKMGKPYFKNKGLHKTSGYNFCAETFFR